MYEPVLHRYVTSSLTALYSKMSSSETTIDSEPSSLICTHWRSSGSWPFKKHFITWFSFTRPFSGDLVIPLRSGSFLSCSVFAMTLHNRPKKIKSNVMVPNRWLTILILLRCWEACLQEFSWFRFFFFLNDDEKSVACYSLQFRALEQSTDDSKLQSSSEKAVQQC